MSRNSINTCVQIPLPGTNFLLRDMKTKNFIKASSVAHRDMKILGKTKIKHIRDISGAPANFACKIGSHNTKIRIIKILVGEEQSKAIDESGRFEYVPMSIRQAKRKHIHYLDPGLVSNKGMLDDIFGYRLNRPSPSRDVPTKMKSGKRMGRPLGSKNRKVVKQEVPALPISELTMRNPENIPVAPTLAPRLAEALAKETQVAEMTLKHPITVSPEQKVKLEAIQKDFDEQVRKLLAEEPQPQAT